MTCFICATDALRPLPMDQRDVLVQAAREILDGMLSTAKSTALKEIKLAAPRRGTCLVERCARSIEAPCGACRAAACQRCEIAAELRGSEDRLNAERDAELLALAGEDEDLDHLVDLFAESLCAAHVPFGKVLVAEWYGRQRSPLAQHPAAPA